MHTPSIISHNYRCSLEIAYPLMILIQVDAVEASFPGNLGDITILHASLLGRVESILRQIITLNLVRQIYMYTKGKREMLKLLNGG